VAYPVNSADLQASIDNLSKVHLSDPLSDDPSHLGLFGLNKSSTTLVSFYTSLNSSMPDLQFYLGKFGTNSNSAYIRFPDQRPVEAQGLSEKSFQRPLGMWLDKTLCNLRREDIDRFKVLWKTGSVEIVKSGNKWKLTHPAKVLPMDKTEDLDLVVEAAAQMQANSVLPADRAPSLKQMGLDKPFLTIKLIGPSPVTLIFGEENENDQYYAKRLGEDRVYFLVTEYKLISPFREHLVPALQDRTTPFSPS
jgi:hypothetical protein